jgi:hypothetical protein
MDDFVTGKRGGIVMVNGGKALTKAQLRAFVEETKLPGEKKRAVLGTVTADAAARVRHLTGISVSTIILDSDRVKHSYGKTSHNLENDDLLHMVDGINTTTDVVRSPKDNFCSPVVIFSDDIYGEIHFVEGVHKKEDGFISLVTAYRDKKMRRGPDGMPGTNPGANVRNDSPLPLLLHENTEMSRAFDKINITSPEMGQRP